MPRYKVKRPYVAADGSLVEPNDILQSTGFEGSKFFAGLLEHDFVEKMEEIPEFKPMVYSELAKVEIADRDYTEDGKRHFTFDEALKIEKKLKDGWRLPTRSEWVLICEEYGQDENGELRSNVLMDHLGLGKHGVRGRYGEVIGAGVGSYYWSRSAHSTTSDAYDLYFHSGSVNPSYYGNRYLGFSLRFVRDRE